MSNAFRNSVTRNLPRVCNDGGALIKTPSHWSAAERFVWLSKMRFHDRFRDYAIDHLQQLASSIDPMTQVLTTPPAKGVLASYGRLEDPTPSWTRSVIVLSAAHDDPVALTMPELPPTLAAVGLLDFSMAQTHLEAWVEAGKIPAGSDIILGKDAQGASYGYLEMMLLRAQGIGLGTTIKALQLDAQGVQDIVERAEARFKLHASALEPTLPSPHRMAAHFVRAAAHIADLAQYGATPSAAVWEPRLKVLGVEPFLLAHFVMHSLIDQRNLRINGFSRGGATGFFQQRVDAHARSAGAMAAAGHPIGSALHLASRHLNVEMARALLAEGADPLKAIDGHSALDVVGAEPRGADREALMAQMRALLQSAAANHAARRALAELTGSGEPAAARGRALAS